MRIFVVISLLFLISFTLSFGFRKEKAYHSIYGQSISSFRSEQESLRNKIASTDVQSEEGRELVRSQIHEARLKLKSVDFWLRYFEPIVYRRINGPLRVEWENEVFEKFEPPYKREGGGLTLAELYLDEPGIDKDSLLALIDLSIEGIATFEADSITNHLGKSDHFFLANRLYLLNLAAIYTTGFECPDTSRIIPELQQMMRDVKLIYDAFDSEYSSTPLSREYLDLYNTAVQFVSAQPKEFSRFDHYIFIRDYAGPLFSINQNFIRDYGVRSRNFNDYSLNNDATEIFSKALYNSQNTKGIYSLIEDEELLKEIKSIGRLLFYDPILSSNNSRSCSSCHKPTEFFADTTAATSFKFDHQGRLARNTPSLVNSIYNHLIMLDGKHISLQDQARDVLHNPEEMNNLEEEMVKKVMSCKEYRNSFRKFLRYTPEEKDVTVDHIASAITFYFADFSQYSSPFDEAINRKTEISDDVKAGFNLFMSKAQCGTCHFVPMFSGVRPPYIGTEFEVLGVPADTSFTMLSPDKGRFGINPAKETANAFRTSTVRNASLTKPYMHNGVFNTLEEVIDFYDRGGGQGRGLNVPNQTLASDSLQLTSKEKEQLIKFMFSLNENVIFDAPPEKLPLSSKKELNKRIVGGEY